MAARAQSAANEAELFEVTETELRFAGLPPEHDGLRIAQLSDIHVGRTTPDGRIISAVRKLNELKPDVVILTGDYVTTRRDPLDRVPQLLRDIAAPTEKQLAAELAALYALRKKDKAADAASAALRFGYADGLMYVAEVHCNGEVSFEEWSDRDCEIALAHPRRMTANQAEALQLWCMLARRQVSRIRELAWQSG